jgi:hypothetical protein
LRGFKRGSGWKFYGRIAANRHDPSDITIVMCGECYNELVADTSLQSYFSQDLTEVAFTNASENGFFCQPYSARSKAVLRETCEKGVLGLFARYWNRREELRKKRDA